MCAGERTRFRIANILLPCRLGAADTFQDAATKQAEARKDASADKCDADYKVAVEKCDALAGSAKDACVSNAKVQYGKP